MSFVEVRFPEDISYGSSGGPQYYTDVVVNEGGYERRNINWQSARAKYNVAHGVKTQVQLSSLLDFFHARKGRAYGFRFKDWSDYQAVGQVIGTGDGAEVNFALSKQYASGGVAVSRKITKLVSGSVKLYLDGVLQSSGVTVDDDSGVVIFDVAPTSGVIISADFEFDVPVRFDTDALSARLDAYGVYSWADIPLVELRV